MPPAVDTTPLIQHLNGPNSGFLNVALEWLQHRALTHDLNDEEALLDAAQNDGLEEAELAAALDYLNGEYPSPLNPHHIK